MLDKVGSARILNFALPRCRDGARDIRAEHLRKLRNFVALALPRGKPWSFHSCGARSSTVPHDVLEAIKMGQWDFEPEDVDSEEFEACHSMPGTPAKLSALAERVSRGLPLWHPRDRQDFDELLE
jgi:hypothetical protein